jgi:hypothetical protein
LPITGVLFISWGIVEEGTKANSAQRFEDLREFETGSELAQLDFNSNFIAQGAQLGSERETFFCFSVVDMSLYEHFVG